MEIKIRHTSSFAEVAVVEGQTTIDLGALSDTERDALAMMLANAAFELGPKYHLARTEWFAEILKRCDIEL